MTIARGRATIELEDEVVELALTRNRRLLTRDAVVVRDGVETPVDAAGLELPYRGYVVGDPSSWVRVADTPAGLRGLIHTDGELWELRERADGRAVLRPAAMTDYLDAPVGAGRTCAVVDAELAAADTILAGEAIAALAEAGCQQLSVALVADYTHVAALGGVAGSEAEMLDRINQTDGIFRADLNLGLVVGELRTFAAQGGPSFNVASAGNTPLDQFASYKQSELPEYGLAHLFVARTDSGKVGQAKVGAICAAVGTAVSNYQGDNPDSTIVVAHEIGHNFGAKHDPEGSPYIMAPTLNETATEFSDASEAAIAAVVAGADCLVPCPAEDPEPPAPEDPEQPEDPEPPAPEQPDGPSCAGVCGGQSQGGCWCDELCSEYGDCCGDFDEVCGADGPEPGSCVGACGGPAEGCWCDKLCSKFGDCCDDYAPVCG